MEDDPRLSSLFRCRATVVWLGFVGATATSWWLGGHESGAAIGVVVLGIGCIKSAVVASDFMELRRAPRPLQLIFAAWITLLFLVLAGIFLAAD